MTRPRRKAIPKAVKKEAYVAQLGLCAECREPLGTEQTEYDHRPPLILRPVNKAGADYIPKQLDPKFIEALHEACHQKRTTGRKPGAEKTVTTKGSDIWLKAKFNRLEGRTKPKRKVKIATRRNPWPKRKFGSAGRT